MDNSDFLEHRQGYLCGWCALDGATLAVQAHPSSEKPPMLFQYPPEIDVLGQVVGTAMLLDGFQEFSSRKPGPRSKIARPVQAQD